MKFFKFLIYVGIMFLFGYYYAVITKGTVFDNFFVMLVSLFIILFLFEWMFSKIKKKNQPEKENEEVFDEDWEKIKTDLKQQFDVKYGKNIILVNNEYNKEELYINGSLMDQNERNRWYHWLWSFYQLNGTIDDYGTTKKVKVKIGGWKNLNCRIYVDEELILKEKIKYKILLGKVERVDNDANK
ncbi:hypothetical protein [Alkalihalobacterium chitinilyticum]|uniref:Uncharacterized protein n=1 Tax=Alkalihalobacterium chitinilyticum TaxID=2980103 RepID=A0ABT5VD29_9BACI|nr:hypothetical protein [Alkalihalobacterium chitinilyticum]MDE5413346.1 hypothetical protein [Alkalihalobacterium chitinilyticum]